MRLQKNDRPEVTDTPGRSDPGTLRKGRPIADDKCIETNDQFEKRFPWKLISDFRDPAFIGINIPQSRWETSDDDLMFRFSRGEQIPGPDDSPEGGSIWPKGDRLLCERAAVSALLEMDEANQRAEWDAIRNLIIQFNSTTAAPRQS